MLFHLSTDFPESNVVEVANSLQPFTITLTPPGLVLYHLVDGISEGKPLRIVETGCLRDPNPTGMMTDGWSTFYFAKWAKDHNSTLTSVEIDPINISYCKLFLERMGLLEAVRFVNKDSVEALPSLVADVFYLDSCDGLDHGLAEFKAALGHKPKLIIMDDFASKGAKAANFAQQQKIPFTQNGRYTIFNLRSKTVNG